MRSSTARWSMPGGGWRPLPTRRVPSAASADDVIGLLGTDLPLGGEEPTAVIDRLAAAVEPGLMANASGRFYGWVMGGALPVAIAADWLVAAWDQNAGMRDATPGVVAAEEVAARWLLGLLGLPSGSAVGFTTGATSANFTCLAAARGRVLERGRLGRRRRRAGGSAAGAGPRGRGGPRVGRPRAALPGAGSPGDRRRRRPGPDGRRGPRDGAGRGGRAGDRVRAGGQHPLGRVRPVRGRRGGRARRRRLGARRRRVRAVGGRRAVAGVAHRRDGRAPTRGRRTRTRR